MTGNRRAQWPVNGPERRAYEVTPSWPLVKPDPRSLLRLESGCNSASSRHFGAGGTFRLPVAARREGPRLT